MHNECLECATFQNDVSKDMIDVRLVVSNTVDMYFLFIYKQYIHDYGDSDCHRKFGNESIFFVYFGAVLMSLK